MDNIPNEPTLLLSLTPKEVDEIRKDLQDTLMYYDTQLEETHGSMRQIRRVYFARRRLVLAILNKLPAPSYTITLTKYTLSDNDDTQ